MESLRDNDWAWGLALDEARRRWRWARSGRMRHREGRR
jgi:hypothetical protein